MRIVPFATIVAVALSGCIPLTTSDESGAGWSEYVPTTADGPFVPATHREGDKVVMPVTFPDGSTAEVVYDPALRLAERGLRAYGSGGFPGTAGRDFFAVRGDLSSWVAGDAPVEIHRGADDGFVESWQTPDGEPPQRLVFRFGSWNVVMRDGGSAERWAAGLRGRETDDGFLVLEGLSGLRLAAAGEHEGPQLMFGDLSPEAVLLIPGWCDLRRDRPPERGSQFAAFCLEGGDAAVSVHVYSEEDGALGDAIAAGLRLRGYTAARG